MKTDNLFYRLFKTPPTLDPTMLGLTHAELQQSRFYQEVFADGCQEGWQEESVALVRHLSQRRFGVLPASQEHLIRRLSLAQTEALAEALLDFQTVADLTVWLAAQ